MSLVENEHIGNSQLLRLYELKSPYARREPVWDGDSNPWLVLLGYGGGSLFGIAFWSAIIWLCL
jgi:hypothetical protein